MGCGSSKQASDDARRPRPAASARPPVNVELQQMGASSSGRSQQYPERTENLLTPAIRAEVLRATHHAFGDMPYGIIGGAALAEYGNRRGTSDLDVIVPHDVSEAVQGHLLSRGLVRTAGGGLGHVASDGRCYGLDVTSDRAVGQNFSAARDIQRLPRTPAHVVTITFLLNSKAYSYMTRVGPDMQAKKINDANDILFIAAYMKKTQMRANKNSCRWVVDYDFWTMFCRDFQGAENTLRALGLERDPTPSPSNRQSRASSVSARSRASSS
ncbi:MAG: hypothetical protein M1837_005228 [Sclerophora amabilis]|nr:MAG: hypothetical protein M1837_005228 [Sclerophora amabilis]